MLSSSFFSGNRKSLKEELKDNLPIAIFSNGLMQRSMDAEYPFEQDRNFFYLTGIDLPEWILVMEEDGEYLISPARSEQEEIFDGKHDLDEAAKISGVKEVVDHKTGLKRLQKHKKVSANTDYQKKQFGVFSNPFAASYSIDNGIKSDDITREILKKRSIKSAEEIREIEEAIKVTEKGFVAAKKIVKDAENEAVVQAEFDKVFAVAHSEHAYSPIVASGSNACTLHYVNNRDSLKGKGLLLIDIGARSNYYAADVSRTWQLTGVSDRQKTIANETKKAFDEIFKVIKLGLHLKDYQKHVDEVMTDSLKNLGLATDKAALGKYFPHAPSHGLGLDVHDPLVGYEEFKEGMVFTLEPGIYIPEEGIGVRYEDDLLITKTGVTNLSEAIS